MLQGIWQEFLNIVREEEGSRVVETWLKAVQLQQWDSIEKVVHVKAPNTFVKDWISSNYQSMFQMHLGRLLNVEQITVAFFVDSGTGASFIPAKEEMMTTTPAVVPSKLPSVSKKPGSQMARVSKETLNLNYTFESFIVGPSNSLAYAAAVAIAEKPGVVYNPLFIYGSSGLGKTHLLHAIGNEIRKNNRAKVVVYQTADRFVNEFISAIRFDRMIAFREKYKNVDVLLIDDIQFIAGKDQTQEAFFHIFNSLYDSHKQIIFSGDTYPKDIRGIAERLSSRMEWGLVADIFMPPLETKVAILKRKAEQNNEALDDEVANFIAMYANSNVRQLEGALVRVIAFAHLTSQKVSLALAQRVLGASIDTSDRSLTLDKIVKAVSRHYSYTIDELRSRGRDKEKVIARQVAMYLMKRLTDKSLREIGMFLGRKDHSTVLHAVSKIESMSREDIKLRSSLVEMEQGLKG